jgi:hypothetical protein
VFRSPRAFFFPWKTLLAPTKSWFDFKILKHWSHFLGYRVSLFHFSWVRKQ